MNLSISVLGMGLSLLSNTLLQYFRVTEHVRLWFLPRNDDLRRPQPWKKVSDYIQTTPDGSIRLLVSPHTAATSLLHVSVLTLPPGRELLSQNAAGLECYLVLQGQGQVSQQGLTETFRIVPGDTFVVDPGRLRWMANTGRTEDLVLWRATDGGNWYSRPDVESMKADQRRSSLRRNMDELVAASGVRQFFGGKDASV